MKHDKDLVLNDPDLISWLERVAEFPDGEDLIEVMKWLDSDIEDTDEDE